MNPPKPARIVLFVCTGNTCRSPMAAALFNSFNTRPGWLAESAGLSAVYGGTASLEARHVLKTMYSIDLADHRSRLVSHPLIQKAEWVLAMTGRQRDALRRSFPEQTGRILTIGEMAGEPQISVSDPYGGGFTAYMETAAILETLVKKIIEKIQ